MLTAAVSVLQSTEGEAAFHDNEKVVDKLKAAFLKVSGLTDIGYSVGSQEYLFSA